jgi:hypothetical protein
MEVRATTVYKDIVSDTETDRSLDAWPRQTSDFRKHGLTFNP